MMMAALSQQVHRVLKTPVKMKHRLVAASIKAASSSYCSEVFFLRRKEATDVVYAAGGGARHFL